MATRLARSIHMVKVGPGTSAALAALALIVAMLGGTASASPSSPRPGATKHRPLAVIKSSFNSDRMTLTAMCGVASDGGSFCSENAGRDRGFIAFTEGEKLVLRVAGATSVRADVIRRRHGETKRQFPPTVHAEVVRHSHRRRWTLQLPTIRRANAVAVFVKYRRPIVYRGDEVHSAGFASRFGGVA